MDRNARKLLVWLGLCVTGCSGNAQQDLDEHASDEANAHPELGQSGTQSSAEANSNPGLVAEAQKMLAAFGGALIQAQSYLVEILPQENGQVQAAIRTADGLPLDSAAQASMAVSFGAGSEALSVPLVWNPARETYVGAVDGALTPGPVQVNLTVQGQEIVGSAPRVAVAPTGSIGGGVMVAGDYAAEVRPQSDGLVKAYVLGPNGTLLNGQANTSVAVTVQASDGAPHQVPLAWNQSEALYVGRLGGNAQMAPGPLTLQVSQNGLARSGRIGSMAVAAAPTHRGEVMVVGDLNVEVVPRRDGKLSAYVADPRGSVRARDLEFHAAVGGREVAFVWNPQLGAYTTMHPVGVDVQAAPVNVVVVHSGRVHEGRMQGVAIPPAQHVQVARRRARRRARARRTAELPVRYRIGRDATPGVTVQAHGPVGRTHGPVGRTHGPVGRTHGPVGRTRDPVGRTHSPVGRTHGPVGRTRDPVGRTHGPVGRTRGAGPDVVRVEGPRGGSITKVRGQSGSSVVVRETPSGRTSVTTRTPPQAQTRTIGATTMAVRRDPARRNPAAVRRDPARRAPPPVRGGPPGPGTVQVQPRP
ncbi:MAG: hypothetical protein AAF355_10700 [Myxococcota bacterium]